MSRCCNYFYDLWQLHGAFQQGLGHRVGRIYNYIHVSRLFIIPSYYHAELCIAYQKATRFGTQYTENKCDILDFQLYNESSSQKHFILAIFGTSLVSNFNWLYLPKLQRQLIHLLHVCELRRIVNGWKTYWLFSNLGTICQIKLLEPVIGNNFNDLYVLKKASCCQAADNEILIFPYDWVMVIEISLAVCKLCLWFIVSTVLIHYYSLYHSMIDCTF